MTNLFRLLFTLVIFWSSHTLAASDSVAVFFTPTKVNVVLNERGTYSRLQEFMNALHWDEKNQWKSEDQRFKFICARNVEAASCTFTFFPSPAIEFGDRQVIANIPYTIPVSNKYEMSFEAANGDSFSLKIDQQNLIIEAKKSR